MKIMSTLMMGLAFCTATFTVSATAQGLVTNMVTQESIDNTCTTDESSAITTYIMGLGANPLPIFFPPGCYKINSGVQLSCTASTCQGLTILGAGRDSTVFESTCTNGYAWWIDSSATTGSYNFGGNYDQFRVVDESGTGACNSLFRITQVANYVVSNLELDSAKGVTYSTGTVSISNGSTALTGTGTTWTSAMFPGVLRIAGKPQMVCTYGSATTATLCDAWQQPTASAQAYSLSYNGAALMLDGGTNFEQYGAIYNLVASGNMFGVFTVPSTSGSIGNSRNKFYGGFINGQRIANSMGFALGQYTDSIDTDTAINSVATCWMLDGAHDNKIMGQCEDDGTATVVTTCNGGVASQACLVGAELTGASTSTSYGNIIDGILTAGLGNAVEVDSTNVINLNISNIRAASFSNTHNYDFEGTTGCPGNGSGISATINDYDCVHTQVTPTVN
jgi:hypothetical protein